MSLANDLRFLDQRHSVKTAALQKAALHTFVRNIEPGPIVAPLMARVAINDLAVKQSCVLAGYPTLENTSRTAR